MFSLRLSTLAIMMGNLQLREQLDRIVSNENSENWWRPHLFKSHTEPILPKELNILAAPPEEDVNFNCFVFAFRLSTKKEILGLSGWEYTRNLHIFVDQLIQEKTLERVATPTKGVLVVYRSQDGNISHVGIYQEEDRIISKWSWGPLLEHKIYDVPASYGDSVEFYSGIEKGCEAILKDFMTTKAR